MNIYSVFKNLAFKFDPEIIHDMTISSAAQLPRVAELFNPLKGDNRYQLSHNGLIWDFPVGIAAGFDKNAKAISFFENLGFGAIEVGTVTKLPQIGNPKPRIKRLTDINSVQNAMGFPNAGAEEIRKNIVNAKTKRINIGTNIGKNKDTSEADTPAEYAYLYKYFADISDYIVINISSPNTPGLRNFQTKELLAPILSAVTEERKIHPKPLFLKIAPDLAKEDIQMLCELSKEYGLSGIIATNTTIQHDFGKGGLSGEYIKPYAKQARKYVCEFLREDPTQTIIGVGGISTFEEIKEFWEDGGHFVQVYTGFIYEGPKLLTQIAKGIDQELSLNQVPDLNTYIKNIRA